MEIKEYYSSDLPKELNSSCLCSQLIIHHLHCWYCMCINFFSTRSIMLISHRLCITFVHHDYEEWLFSLNFNYIVPQIIDHFKDAFCFIIFYASFYSKIYRQCFGKCFHSINIWYLLYHRIGFFNPQLSCYKCSYFERKCVKLCCELVSKWEWLNCVLCMSQYLKNCHLFFS